MKPYTPTKIRPLRLVAMLLRGLVSLLSLWPLLLFGAFFLSPLSPHMRWQYTYEQRGDERHYIACEYLGARGFVRHVGHYGQCPFFTMIDRRVVK